VRHDDRWQHLPDLAEARTRAIRTATSNGTRQPLSGWPPQGPRVVDESRIIPAKLGGSPETTQQA
jgi:hypothetical protein